MSGSSCMDGTGKETKSHVSGGPWGGEGGTRWDDGVHCSIRQMIITHGGAVIDSVQFEYADAQGCAAWSEKRGGGGGGGGGIKTDKVRLDHPDEYLLSVGGCYGAVSERGPVVVRSLQFETNRRRFGPFGVQKGTHFSFALTGGKIVGFFGRSGLHLDSLGVYVKPFVSVRTVQAQAHGLAQAHMGVGAGNRGYDIMVAVRQKMDDMALNGRGFGEFERKGKVFTSEAVDGNNRYNGDGQVGRERERFTFVTNQAYRDAEQAYKPQYEEIDQAAFKYQGVLLSSQPRGVPLGGRSGPYVGQAAREKDGYMISANHQDRAFREYETIEKVYGTTAAEKGYNPNMRQNDGNIYTHNNGFAEYETKEKVYNTSGTSPTKGRPTVSYGPWGGSGGMLFDDGVFTGVREIHLSRSGGVVSIRVCYDMNGRAVWGDKNGGSGAIRLDKISLDYPEEVLTRVSGYYGSSVFRGPTVVKSLTFYTNRKKYGPFGEEQGIPFSSAQKQGVVVGFHGRKGWFVDSIGVHFLEGKQFSLPTTPPCFDMYTNTTSDMRFIDQVVPEPVKGPIQSGPGPWGGNGGSPWDDGVFTGIRKILLTKGSESIYAIQIEYDCNGKSFWSDKHGNNNEGTCHVIKFEYPQEVVTCISGYYGSVGGDEYKKVVKSLTFHTNRGMYGPYGDEIGSYFTSAKTQTKIVGFHGNSGCHLYAIGVHTQHWLPDRVDSGPIKTMFHKIFAN